MMCTVTNSIGEIAYDIYEFYLNEAPQSGITNFTVVGETGSGTAPTSLYNLTLSNW